MSQNKITQESRDRIAAHTLQDQLIAHVEEMLAERRREQEHDQSDITTAFEADTSWSGQHARLMLPIEGAD
jgi:hypothetical protein